MKVAVAQLAPTQDAQRNVERTVEAIREAARQGAELLVLPEMCTSPYLVAETKDQWAEDLLDGKVVRCWQQEAKAFNLTLVAGVLEQAADGCFNTALALGPQGVLATYRKTHLFGWERQHLEPGQKALVVLEISGIKIGMLVCYDLRFIEAMRLLALQGVHLLCVPTAWTNIGKPNPLDQNNWCAAAHLAVGHAYANRFFVLCAGRVGREADITYLGNSLIVSPAGEVLAGPGLPNEEAVFVAEIDPREAENKHIGRDNHVFEDRRTDLYQLSSTIVSPPTEQQQEG